MAITELHVWMGRPELDVFLQSTNIHNADGTGKEGVTKHVTAMLDWGHRYKTIDQSLGNGTSLCLGINLPETQ